MQFDERCFQLRETNKWTARVESATAYIVDHAVEVPMTSAMQRAWAVTWSRWPFGWLYTAICTVLTAVRRRRYRWLHHPAWVNDWQSRQLDFAPARAAHQTVNARQIKQRCAAHQRVNDVSGFCALGNRQTMMSDNRRRSLYPQICIEYSRLITCQSNTSKGRGHDRLPNWNSKNGGMLISQPISRCLTNHSELCMSRLLNNQPRVFLFIGFSDGHLSVSSLRCLQLRWQVVTLCLYQRKIASASMCVNDCRSSLAWAVGFNCFGLFYLLLSFLAPAECGRFQ